MKHNKDESIPTYDFDGMTDLDLVIMRKDSLDMGDIEFVKAIDKELKKRLREHHEAQTTEAPTAN